MTDYTGPLIVVDVDGVVADLMGAVLQIYNSDWDDRLTLEDVKHYAVHKCVKPECGAKIYDYFSRERLYESVDPIAGAKEVIDQLRERGYRIVFATTCAEYSVDDKARWMVRHGFLKANSKRGRLPQDFIHIEDKSLIDGWLLIDDHSDNVRRWVEQRGRPAILMARPWNESILDDVHSNFWLWCKRARQWSNVIAHIETLAKPNADRQDQP